VTVPPASALLVDLYELTMGESYLAHDLAERPATFQLTCRRLPPGWGYLVAAGVEDALEFLEHLRFAPSDLARLEQTGLFGGAFLERLGRLRFSGEVRAMPEGTLFFPGEPVLEVTAPLLEGQLAETAMLNLVHASTLIASKASRCVDAAAGRTLVEFGLRRVHGGEAGLKTARASYLAGFAATSNVLAGTTLGIPVAGTMAHSFVECFEDETEAFEAYLSSYPGGSTLLIDTYDTIEGARRAARAGLALRGRGGRLGAVRLDSGDLLELSAGVREVLDEAGLPEVELFASGNLDEHEIARLIRAGAPIDGFGIGTRLGTPVEAPFLETAYKLVSFAGRPVAKLSRGKESLPGSKQVWRRRDGDRFDGDLVTLEGEPAPPAAEPLLRPALRDGTRIGRETLVAARERAAEQRAGLAPELREPDAATYPVEVSAGLTALAERVRAARLPSA
jgi:nicotinate phosphoribosyltransferase